MNVDPNGTHWKCLTCGTWFSTLVEAQAHNDNPPHPHVFIFSVEELEGEE